MVYIPPRTSAIGVHTLPSRSPAGASRKLQEIFQDRIFHGAPDANLPSTPNRKPRSLESIQTLSAPATFRRNQKAAQNVSPGNKSLRLTQVQEKYSATILAQDSRGVHTKSPGLLRRRKTVQDLRSSDSVPTSDEPWLKSSSVFPSGRVYPRAPVARRSPVPLSSRTNRLVPIQPLESEFASLNDSCLVSKTSSQLSNINTFTTSETKLHSHDKSSSHDIEMSDNGAKITGWSLRNVHDHLENPEDFHKSLTRSFPVSAEGSNPHVSRIDVTLEWSLSRAEAETAIRCHRNLRAALRETISDDVQGILSEVVKNFDSREGSFAYLDGLRVSYLDKWIGIHPEELVDKIIDLEDNFFSETEHQPQRSALMQLYLCSTECFLNRSKYGLGAPYPSTGVSIRTFHDQFSRFEVPVARAASYSDFVRFIDLNPTPREDEELSIIPEYNREGIFVQEPCPKNVEYRMEEPIAWLQWDDSINGFRGRVPSYSDFLGVPRFDRSVSDDGSISHVLKVTIIAKFRKNCSTGPAYFETTVRTLLTFNIQTKYYSSIEHSVYGIDAGHEPVGLSFQAQNYNRTGIFPMDPSKWRSSPLIRGTDGLQSERGTALSNREIPNRDIQLPTPTSMSSHSASGGQIPDQTNTTCSKQLTDNNGSQSFVYDNASRWGSSASCLENTTQTSISNSNSSNSTATDEGTDTAATDAAPTNAAPTECDGGDEKIVSNGTDRRDVSADGEFAMQEAIRRSLRQQSPQTQSTQTVEAQKTQKNSPYDLEWARWVMEDLKASEFETTRPEHDIADENHHTNSKPKPKKEPKVHLYWSDSDSDDSDDDDVAEEPSRPPSRAAPSPTPENPVGGAENSGAASSDDWTGFEPGSPSDRHFHGGWFEPGSPSDWVTRRTMQSMQYESFGFHPPSETPGAPGALW